MGPSTGDRQVTSADIGPEHLPCFATVEGPPYRADLVHVRPSAGWEHESPTRRCPTTGRVDPAEGAPRHAESRTSDRRRAGGVHVRLPQGRFNLVGWWTVECEVDPRTGREANRGVEERKERLHGSRVCAVAATPHPQVSGRLDR